MASRRAPRTPGDADKRLARPWPGPPPHPLPPGGAPAPACSRQAGLGPLIGTRTWGGLIGISGAPALVDGGGVTVPTFRMFDPKGQWFAEGHGVEPDIAVDDDPAQLAKGIDPQLQRAIKEVSDAVAREAKVPGRPEYERRIPKSSKE